MIRWVIKRVLNAAGYSVRRKFTPIRTLGEFCSILERMRFHPGTVFDVGVAQGTPELYTYVSRSGALLVLVEPLEEFEGYMRELLRKHRGFVYLAAAGEVRGEVVLNLYSDLRKTSRYKKVDMNDRAIKTRKVRMIPLDDILGEHELPGPYLLKIDVEGDELSVLKGAKLILTQTEVVIVETSVSRRFEGGSEFADIVTFLRGEGFRLCDIVGAADGPEGLLMQLDLAFLRVDGMLAKKMSQ